MAAIRLSIPEDVRHSPNDPGAPADIRSMVRRLSLVAARTGFVGVCPTCEKLGFVLRPIPTGVEVGCAACGDPGLIHLSMLRQFSEARLATFAGGAT